MKLKTSDLESAKKLIDAAKHIVIISPDSPDIDSVSSNLALASTFRDLGKEVTLLSSEPMSEEFAWAEGYDSYLTKADVASLKKAGPDLAVITDSGSLVQLRKVLEGDDWLVRETPTLVIDHHANRDDFAPSAALIDPDAAATGVLLFEIYQQYQWKITPLIARYLIAGIYADTGSFQNKNTAADVFETAARLTELEADPYQTNQDITQATAFSPDKFKVLASLMTEARFDGPIAYGLIEYSRVSRFEPNAGFTYALGSQIRFLKGIRVSFVISQKEDDTLRLSIRSQPGIDVSKVAKLFGGGGHTVASGATISGIDLETAAAKVVAAIKEQL